VPELTPTSRATTSIAALSGGSNRATALSLNVCPYRAKSVLDRRPLGLIYGGNNYSDAGGTGVDVPGQERTYDLSPDSSLSRCAGTFRRSEYLVLLSHEPPMLVELVTSPRHARHIQRPR
jgi:hypothetical protein